MGVGHGENLWRKSGKAPELASMLYSNVSRKGGNAIFLVELLVWISGNGR
jgi:hypothetical protein